MTSFLRLHFWTSGKLVSSEMTETKTHEKQLRRMVFYTHLFKALIYKKM